MSEILDALIIETYPQLMAVIACTAIIAALLRSLLLRASKRRVERARTGGGAPVATERLRKQGKHERARLHDKIPATGKDFDKLATVISEANDRAGHISDTQSAAAIKLDAAEMAVIRLRAEIDGIMTTPGVTKGPTPPLAATSHHARADTSASRVAPLPIPTDRAA